MTGGTGELRGKSETGNWERTGQQERKSRDRTTLARKERTGKLGQFNQDITTVTGKAGARTR
jgi:hypothetical protein